MMDAFTEAEKRFVLAEYIKASQVETGQLVEFIKTYNLQADWFAMQLPGGRNMHQCMRAASQLLDRELQVPNLPNMKRKSVGDFSEHVPKRVASMTPIQYQPQPRPPPLPLPQPPPVPHHQPPPVPHHQPQLPQLHQPAATSRAIQPRPSSDPKQPTADGYGVFQSKSPSNGYGVFQSNPTVRKRGRPSKAEKEAQARANSSTYPTSTPIPISPKPTVSPVTGTPVLGHAATGTTYHPAPRPTDLRLTGGGNVGGSGETTRGFPRHYTEQAKSEKSPSIGNLVTPDPTREPHSGSSTSLVGPAVCEPPPVTNSA